MNEPNELEKVDPMQYVSLNILILRWTGQWFNHYGPGSVRYWRSLIVKHLFLFIAYTFPICGEVLYLTYHHDDVGQLAESLYLFLTEIFSPVKVAIFTWNKLQILDLLSEVKSAQFLPTEPEHVDIIKKAIRKARYVAVLYSALCCSCVFASCLVPIGENFKVLPTNVEYPGVNVTTSPAYEIIYIFHVMTYKPLGVIIHCAVETFPPVLMACAIAQLQILAFNMENLELLTTRAIMRSKRSKRNLQDRRTVMKNILRKCIKHHCCIENFVRKVEGAYSQQIASQFLLSACVICLTGVQFFSIEDPLKKPVQIMWMFTYLAAMICAVYMVCYFGDAVISNSEHLAVASYSGAWPALPARDQRSLLIFRERCRRPLAVRGANFFDISLITFTTLMKWSFNVFAVVNQMR